MEDNEKKIVDNEIIENQEVTEAQREKSEKILESLSGIDGELVERSMEAAVLSGRKKILYRRYLASAAVLAVMVLGGLGIYYVSNKGSVPADKSAEAEILYTVNEAVKADGETGADEGIEAAKIVEMQNSADNAIEAEEDGLNLTTEAKAEISEEEALTVKEALNTNQSEAAADSRSGAESYNSIEEKEPAEEAQKTALSLEGKSTETQNWGLSFGESGTQPRGNASPEEMKPYNAYYMGSPDDKVIYLTFDCGYENGYAPMILDTLKKHDVKVTFFVVGTYIKYNPEIVKRMVDEGHNVGNHSYTHPDMSQILTEEGFLEEMEGVSDVFEELIGGKMTTFYRPPQGKFNWVNLDMANRLGYYTIFWSLAHVDWDVGHQPDHSQTIEMLNSRIHPGAVVLLHIISQTNAEILDELLTDWEEMGYRFGTLNELCGVE